MRPLDGVAHADKHKTRAHRPLCLRRNIQHAQPLPYQRRHDTPQTTRHITPDHAPSRNRRSSRPLTAPLCSLSCMKIRHSPSSHAPIYPSLSCILLHSADSYFSLTSHPVPLLKRKLASDLSLISTYLPLDTFIGRVHHSLALIMMSLSAKFHVS